VRRPVTAAEAAARVAGLRALGWRRGALHVFATGSLIYHPECVEELVGYDLGTLAGHRRVFNQRSTRPGCAKDRSIGAFPAPGFDEGPIWRSLMLGTEPAPHGQLRGVLLAYRGTGVLASMDQREAGYSRTEVVVRHDRTGEALTAVAYMNAPAVALSLDEQARVLANATARPDRTLAEARIGLYYLERVRAALRTLHVVDPDLEAVAAAVHALGPGPWRALVAAPARTL
jgi:cation transport regulator ChaC